MGNGKAAAAADAAVSLRTDDVDDEVDDKDEDGLAPSPEAVCMLMILVLSTVA